MSRHLAVAVAALALGACAPSINPQMKSATDGLLGAVKGGHNEAAPSSYQPMPWSEGQWVLLRVTDANGNPSVTRISVVGRENGGFWIEQENYDYFRHTLNKVFYSRMPRTAEEAVDAMLKMVSKEDDKPTQVFDFGPTNPAASFTKSLMKHFATGIVVPENPEAAGSKDDAAVAAGTFQACIRYPGSYSFGPVSKQITGWFHPAVPINGAIKGKSTDGEYTLELLDYGTSGAVSKLP